MMISSKAIRAAAGLTAVVGLALVVAACVPAAGGHVAVSDEGVSGFFEPPYAGPVYAGGYIEPPPVYLPPSPRVVYGEVPYVVGVSHPVYYVDRYFYTNYDDRWYVTARPGGAWATIESTGVPETLRRGAPTIRREAAVEARPVTEFAEALPPGARVIPPRAAQPSERGLGGSEGAPVAPPTTPVTPGMGPEGQRMRPRPGARMPGRAG